MQRTNQKKIIRKGKVFQRRRDGSYSSGDGDILETAIVLAVLSGNGHPCSTGGHNSVHSDNNSGDDNDGAGDAAGC